LEDNGIPIDHIGGKYIRPILIVFDLIHFKVPVSVPSLVVYMRKRSTSYPVLLGQVKLAGDWEIYGECYPTSRTLSWPTQQYVDIRFARDAPKISFSIRGMSSTALFTKRSTICISKICGFPSSAIQRTSRHLGWRYTRLVMLGDSFVSRASSPFYIHETFSCRRFDVTCGTCSSSL
jgi:hypothetical protein